MITHHAEVRTIEGGNWINLNQKDVEFLKGQLELDKEWIDVAGRYFSSKNVVSISIIIGKWVRPDQR